MYIGHVGDSRCYRVRDGVIQLLTRDHSLFNDYLLAMPDLTEEQRRELPKNVITRALGMQDQVAVDLQHDQSQHGDTYVLCSDGLSGMIPDDEILTIVQTSPDIREACRKLIERANERGGEDNITAVLIHIEDESLGKTVQGTTVPEEEKSPVSARAIAPTEAPPPGSGASSVTAPTNPAPQIVMPPPGTEGKAEFGEEPTMPAIDIRKVAREGEFGEEPTMPALDLSKELSRIKKPES